VNEYFAEWYEVADIKPDPEVLKRRWEGVQKASENPDTQFLADLGRLFYGRGTGADKVEKLVASLREVDSTFASTGKNLELAILAAAVLREVLREEDGDSDFAALVIIAPYLQGARNTGTVPVLIDIAEQYLVDRSLSLRSTIPSKGKAIGVSKELVDAVAKAFDENTLPNATEPFGKIITSINQSFRVQGAKIVELTEACELFREESDMLWWLTAMHSRIANSSYNEIKPASAALLMGKELADLTRVIPGPLAVGAFIQRMMTQCYGNAINKDVQLSSAVNGLDHPLRETFAQRVAASSFFDLCPVANAIVHSTSVGQDAQWPPLFKQSQGLDAKLKISPVALSRQVYLESLLLSYGGTSDGS
jgi:hypothetical protein